MATFNDRAPRTFNMRASRAMLAACLFYAAFGGLIQWFPIWLIEERGFTGEQLGLVISLAGIGRIVAGPLTSAWADGRKDRRAPIQLLAAISLLALEARGFDSLRTGGNSNRDSPEVAARTMPISEYTRGHDCHWSAQISAMPPDTIIARR